MSEDELNPANKKRFLPRMAILISGLLVLALAYLFYSNPSFLSDNLKINPSSNDNPNKNLAAQNEAGINSLIEGGTGQIVANQMESEPIFAASIDNGFDNQLEIIREELQSLKNKLTKLNFADKLNLSGGELTGELEIQDNLTLNSTAKTESIIPQSDDSYDLGSEDKGFDNAYVHQLFGSSILTVGNNVTTHALNKNYDMLISGNLEVDGDTFFDGDMVISGSTYLDGNLDLGNYVISNLSNPISSQDAATKVYVDTQMGSAGYQNGGGADLNLANANLLNVANINGILSSTELGFLNGVTSEIQTQFSDLDININALDTSKEDSLTKGDVNAGTGISISGDLTDAVIGNGITISIPQSIATTASPTFAGLTLGASGLNMSDNLVTNIGNAGTNFTAGGGLDLAGDFEVSGTGTFLGTADIAGNLGVAGDALIMTQSATAFQIKQADGNDVLTVDTTDNINGYAYKPAMTFDGRVGFFGDGETAYANDATLEVSSTHATDIGSIRYLNSLMTELNLQATSATPNNVTATNNWFRVRLEGSETYENDVTNSMFITNFSTNGAYTIGDSSTAFEGVNGIRINFSEGPQKTGTYNLRHWNGIQIDGEALSSSAINVSDLYSGIYVGDLDTMTNGTIAAAAGLWVEKQVIGDSGVNYGIVLDGTGAGSDIVFGANQEAKISYDGSDLQYNGMPLNDIGSKSVCSAWASVVNPYMCLSYLTPTTTETDMIDATKKFSYENISLSEVVAKSQVWTVQGMGGNEYLCNDTNSDGTCDNSSLFSFGNGTTDSAFSGVAWVKVPVHQTTNQVIMGKMYTNAVNSEWEFWILNDDTLQLSLVDTDVAFCAKTSSIDIPSLGEWHMLGFSYDGTTEATGITLYLDGQPFAGTGTANCESGGYTAMSDTSTAIFSIGSGYNTNYFKGYLGHMIISDSFLTDDQMEKLYNSSKMFYGL